MNSATDSYWESVTRSGKLLGSGSESDGTKNRCSACTCNTTLLVTITLSCGQVVRSSATCTAALTTCSKLSRSSNICLRCNFFFQAEDGIRAPLVTGVQTCALPILVAGPPA